MEMSVTLFVGASFVYCIAADVERRQEERRAQIYAG